MIVTVDLDDAQVKALRDLRAVRQVIHETHQNLSHVSEVSGTFTCKCANCEYEGRLTRELEGVILFTVMKEVTK